ncbi:dihydroorotate dehydrogenase (fumarate) [Gammaproteobacteria bacterium]
MDLRTTFMGLELKNPIVAAASPLSGTLDGIRRLEDGGVSAIVMFSLFEEQIRHENATFDHLIESGTESFAESLSYFPRMDDYRIGPERYIELLQRASQAVDIPIIASLNGVTNEGWIDYARQMQNAGAKGIELNIYYIPADIQVSGEAVERRYLEIVHSIKKSVSVPVSLKLSPFFSSVACMARQFDEAGIDGLVLFNRFYQPDLDIDNLEVLSSLSLSTSMEIRLPLLWIAVLYGRIRASLGATRGVEGAEEVIKYLLAGADAVMIASVLLKNGAGFSRRLLQGLEEWMEGRGYDSVSRMKGVMSQQLVADPSAFERANYIRLLKSYHSGAG